MHKYMLNYNVSFVAVNDRSDKQISVLKRIVRFPVFQDTASWNFWSQVGGGKDHFLVFDKCGRLISHMKTPELRKFFKKAWNKIAKAYNRRRCKWMCPIS